MRDPIQPSRRRFLLGTGSAALLGAFAGPAGASSQGAPVALSAERRVIEVRGRAATVAGLRQPNGTHGLRLKAGDRFRVALTNRLSEPTLIHWHGLRPPVEQDGMPGVSQPLLEPGAAYQYDFALRDSGTYWMHSHHGLQEQALLAAPLIIAEGEPADEQEVVLMLHDFSFDAPEEILASLKTRAAEMTRAFMAMAAGGGHSAHGASSHGASTHGTAGHGTSAHGHGGEAAHGTSAHGHGGEAAHGTSSHGHGGAAHEHAMHGGAHLNDVEFDAYLANDRTLADPELVQVERIGRVRLRIINGASSTNFHIDLGALEGELIAVDGRPVHPVRGRRFGIAMSQRIDLRIEIRDAGAFPILALREGDRQATGIVLHTPGAAVRRVGETVHEAAPALGFAEEERLSALAPLPARPADQSLSIALTSDMTSYGWGLDGSEAAAGLRDYPIQAGERVEITFENRTHMSHPMHLHGHLFQVVGTNGRRFSGALRDTVLVPQGATVTIALDADNPGSWMLHCHNLYHQVAGMMAMLRYA